LVENHKTNLLSLVSLWLALSATVTTCANDRLIMLNRFVFQFPDELCNLFFYQFLQNSPDILPMWHPKNFHLQSKQGLILHLTVHLELYSILHERDYSQTNDQIASSLHTRYTKQQVNIVRWRDFSFRWPTQKCECSHKIWFIKISQSGCFKNYSSSNSLKTSLHKLPKSKLIELSKKLQKYPCDTRVTVPKLVNRHHGKKWGLWSTP